MTRADNSRFVARAAALRHQQALDRVRSAIENLDRSGHAVTYSSVARAAGASRGWLYSQPELRDTIERLRTQRPSAPAIPSSQRATTASLRERLDGLREEISRLRTENTTLRDQLARRLGEDRIHH